MADPRVAAVSAPRAPALPAERLAFAAAVACAGAIFWIAPLPPMTDLPQHAAQVALWRDLLLGTSPWVDLMQVNLRTPYLVGYGLALPLSLAMPVAAALKLLLTLACIGFVAACMRLRRRFGGDPLLDWLYPMGFFGLACQWGFFTFLVAAPVGLLFIDAAARHAEAGGTARSALRVVGIGVALLFCHGLVFAFALAVGAALQAAAGFAAWRHGWAAPRRARLARAVLPHAVLVAAAVAVFLASRRFEARYAGAPQEPLVWDATFARAHQAFANAFGVGGILLAGLTLAALAAPWLMGLRWQRRHAARLVPLAVVVLVLAAVPHVALNTAFLYQRFALFLLPAYAWSFAAAPDAAARVRPVPRLAFALLVIACWSTLGAHALRFARFARESADFEAVLQAMQPGRRAIALVYDRDSPAARHPSTYLHWAAWYQAQRGGLVDFNFAWFPPQVVRYRPERAPLAAPGFEWHPERFDWQRHSADGYAYVVVRRTRAGPDPFAGVACAPRAVAASGAWTVYARRGCP